MAAPPTAQVEGASCYSFNCPQPFHPCGRAYSFRGLAESHMIPVLYLHGREESSFPGSAPPNGMVNSEPVMVFKSGDSGVVNRYRVNEFSHNWLAECIIAQ